MSDYTAEDGLRVLTHLGILNLTDREREVFRGKWDGVYKMRGGSLISTTWTLYAEVLPFLCREDGNEQASMMVKQMRDRDFGERLEQSKLDQKLREGMSLNNIIAASPEKYGKLN